MGHRPWKLFQTFGGYSVHNDCNLHFHGAWSATVSSSGLHGKPSNCSRGRIQVKTAPALKNWIRCRFRWEHVRTMSNAGIFSSIIALGSCRCENTSGVKSSSWRWTAKCIRSIRSDPRWFQYESQATFSMAPYRRSESEIGEDSPTSMVCHTLLWGLTLLAPHSIPPRRKWRQPQQYITRTACARHSFLEPELWTPLGADLARQLFSVGNPIESLGSRQKGGRMTVEPKRISLAVSKFCGSFQAASCPFSPRKMACTTTAEPWPTQCKVSTSSFNRVWAASFFPIKMET